MPRRGSWPPSRTLNSPGVSRNIGTGEQRLRLAIGVVLIGVALFAELLFGWALLAFGAGLAALSTALARRCPVNAALGRDSSN